MRVVLFSLSVCITSETCALISMASRFSSVKTFSREISMITLFSCGHQFPRNEDLLLLVGPHQKNGGLSFNPVHSRSHVYLRC